MSYSNIFLISDNPKISNLFQSQVFLSRKNDCIFVSDFKNALNYLSEKSSDVIIINVETKFQLEFIKNIRNNEFLKNCFVIMVTDTSNVDVLSDGYDLGYDDIIDNSANDTIICMKILWALKHKMKSDILQKKIKEEAFLKITDKNTGFYTESYTDIILENEYKNYLISYKNIFFMLLAPDKSYLKDLSVTNVGKLVCKLIRNDDVGGYTKDNKIILVLTQTDRDGVKNIFDKINKALPLNMTISAAACNVSAFDNYGNVIKTLNRNLQKALKNKKSFIFTDEQKSVNPDFEKFNPSFRNSLAKETRTAYEKIIMPCFFKMQSIYEPILFGCEIKQLFTEKECSFEMKKEELKYLITFKYTSFKSITAEIKEKYNQSVSCDNIFLSFDESLAQQIEKIIQKYAEKFRIEINRREL